jgi:hypothetical protein
VSVGRLPPATPQLPAARPQPSPEARAAQRAFFAAATGRAEVDLQPAAAAVASPVRDATPAEEPPRYVRPGSLLDIKV